MSVSLSYHCAVLPWTVSAEDERRFRRILTTVLLLCLIFGLVMPWLPRPVADQEHPEELPQRYAKMLLERKPLPPPEVTKRETTPEPKTCLLLHI